MLAIGHSTRPAAELISLLRAHGVRTLADIRTIPRSRHNPQYEASALAATLAAAGIGYVHLPRLGGLRRPRPDSPNRAWRNASFRGYADHMLTAEFAEGLDELRTLARQGPVAIMCAEAVPWRCHRSLVADALWVRGVVVEHVTGPGTPRPHRLTPFAVVSGRAVTYPAADATGSDESEEDTGGRGRAPLEDPRKPVPRAKQTRGGGRQPRSAPRGGGGAGRSRAPAAR